MGHEHIRPTRTGAWGITVPTGMAKMEIQSTVCAQATPIAGCGMPQREVLPTGSHETVYRTSGN